MRARIPPIGALLFLLLAGMADAAERPLPKIEAQFRYGQALQLDFDQPMQTWGNERRADVVRLQPALPTQCVWDSDTRLTCSFDIGKQTPAAATRYGIRLAEGLKTQEGAIVPAQTLHAETERPTLMAGIEGWRAGLPQIIVQGSEGTTRQSLAAVLRLTIDGKSMPLPPLRKVGKRHDWDREDRYALALPASSGRTLALSVAPGLASSVGPLRGVQDQKLLAAEINEPFRLRGVACAGRDASVSATPDHGVAMMTCLPGETVQLVFSRPLDAVSQTRLADALPAGVEARDWKSADVRDYRPRPAAAQAPAHWLELRIERAGARVVIPINADLRAEGSGPAIEPARVEINNGDYRPQLRARHAAMLVEDGRHPPTLLEARNAPPAGMVVHGIGARTHGETLQAPTQRSNAPVVIESRASTATLAEGGWVRWTPQGAPARSNPYAHARAALQFAAPAFDLFAVAGRREVLAWANAWEGDRGIAGAEVELLWLDAADAQPRVVTRAKTAEDGVAMLRLPDELIVPENRQYAEYPMWLLRAATGRRKGAARAVMPIGSSWHYGLVLGRDAPDRFWGVADRPLYRAGDSVRYHLWQRQENAGRLLRISRPQPLTLLLYNQDEGKTILEWQATPDASGAISGKQALPVHLSDATYCIGEGEDYSIEGICFFVGTYRAQDLWAEAKTEDRVLRDGDRFAVDLEAGYYSGGPASGVTIARVTTMLTGLPLQQAYPQYESFDFIDVMTDDARDGIALADEAALHRVADRDGKARIDLPVRFAARSPDENIDLPAFGTLQLVAEAKLSDREATATNAARARYTRHARFVGLRVEPRWLDATTPVKLEGIVIDAAGNAIVDAPIEVDIGYLAGFDDDKDVKPQSIGRCALAARTLTDCDFPRTRSGRYRITARSGNAAPVEITRYVWAGDDDMHGDVGRTQLELLEAPRQIGAPARILLKQPKASARVLFVTSIGDGILAHRVETIAGNARGYAIDMAPQWRRQVAITAYVRDAAAPTPSKDGLRMPVQVSMDTLQVPLPPDDTHRAPLGLAFGSTAAAPGDSVRITLRNDGAQPRDVVLAVMDDALRALADDWLPYFDPQGEYWLGADRSYFRDGLTSVSFGGWNRESWFMALPWPDTKAGRSAADRIAGEHCTGSQAAERAACEAAEAAAAAADAAAGAAGGEPVPVQFAQAGVVFDDPSAIDTPLRSTSAQPRIAQVAPAPPAPMADVGANSTSLDRIEVTGSRISRADTFSEGTPPTRGLRPRDAATPRAEQDALRALARVRTQFADTALWQPDIHLAPGESRSIELKLPDNLTRWRAIAWSSDADDDFDMVQATLEVGLPVEVRLQAPARLYPGDRSRVAANVRQTDDAVAEARVELRSEGIGAGFGHAQALPLSARGQASFAMDVAPTETGSLLTTATAETPAGRDAVAAPVEVASPLIAARKLQAGWLGNTPLSLDLPALPAGAHDAYLQVSLLRGGAGLVERWSNDLRDYPHRCWEQILSRAVAAALSIERGDAKAWPDAPAVVREALDNAAVFQGEDGDFRYFADAPTHGVSMPERRPQVALTAYTVQAFALLRSLGHPVAVDIDQGARAFLEGIDESDDGDIDAARDESAFALSTSSRLDHAGLDKLWRSWDKLSLPAQVAATRALAAGRHSAADDAMARLLANAPARGPARVLKLPQRYDRWMSSDLREQCALIALLGDYPVLGDADVRRGLIAGLTDLYAGGIETVDTQTGAYCLIALRSLAAARATDSPSATLALGDAGTQLRLQPGHDRAEWKLESPATSEPLRIVPDVASESPLSYVAELRYQDDARQARAAAVGLSIERRFEVLRGGSWASVSSERLREGDWVRITLIVQSSAPRYFVAITDAVPGGLRPTDLALGSIAGLDLKKISSEGSWWFGTRKLDPRSPRFYAEHLPAGRHELHYFARVANSGDYLAAPATVELMYGNATNARTAAGRLQIADKASAD